MRRLLFRIGGLCLASLVGLALAHGSELDGKPSVPGPAVKPATPPPQTFLVKDKPEATCGSHGTRVEFVATPSKAAQMAKKEQKLVFVLHVSGDFEDPRFT
jgi:hypothetical protein